MKERPVLFSGPMVRAILDYSKTQTRRVAKVQPEPATMHPACRAAPCYIGRAAKKPGGDLLAAISVMWHTPKADGGLHIDRDAHGPYLCPYGAAGDRLWVRETWCGGQHGTLYQYRADWPEHDYGPRWRPSIHMPRQASRITLGIIDIRLERVQDISEDDAVAEGVTIEDGNCCAVGAFEGLWNSINAKRGLGWDENPWVWVVGFRRIEEVA